MGKGLNRCIIHDASDDLYLFVEVATRICACSNRNPAEDRLAYRFLVRGIDAFLQRLPQ